MSTPVYAPSTVQDVWDNHMGAFGAKDMEKTLLDYDEESVIATFDQTANEKKEYKGLEGVRTFVADVFEKMTDLSDLESLVMEVTESPVKMAFVVWRCPASGFADSTDTVIFGDNFKISRQNVVFRAAAAS